MTNAQVRILISLRTKPAIRLRVQSSLVPASNQQPIIPKMLYLYYQYILFKTVKAQQHNMFAHSLNENSMIVSLQVEPQFREDAKKVLFLMTVP